VYLLIDIDGSDVHGIVSELVHAVIFIYDGVMYVLYDKSAIPKIYSMSATVTPRWVHSFFSRTFFI